ncbi:MAG: hypothetical protein ACM3ML_24885 [Micromonosporaceae bacterium]
MRIPAEEAHRHGGADRRPGREHGDILAGNCGEAATGVLKGPGGGADVRIVPMDPREDTA